MTTTTTLRKAAYSVAERLVAAGFVSHLVGGCVRDTLLENEPHDFDITTNATPSEVAGLFPGEASFVGAHFGVTLIKVDGHFVEVATWRQDGEYSDNRHPDAVTFAQSVAEDVCRRDFTVNALLMDICGNVVDLVGGVNDLHNQLIRCVGNPSERFAEDALRMLRAVRFCAQLGFTLHSATFDAIVANASRVQSVSAERVTIELGKMLTSGRAGTAVQLLLDTGLATFILPELQSMANCEHNNLLHHPEGSVANHTVLLLNTMQKNCSLTLALAGLLHDIGKPSTCRKSNGRTTFYSHADVGATMAESILRRFRFSNDVIETVVGHVRNHMKLFNMPTMCRSTLMRFARHPQFSELLELGYADARASNGDVSHIDYAKHFLATVGDILHQPRLVTGDDLIAMGLQPGPQFRELLAAVETEQLDGHLLDRTAALAFVSSLKRK